MSQPMTTVTHAMTPTERAPGVHTMRHIMRVIADHNLHKPRHWVQDRGASERLIVEMPDVGANVRITRANPTTRLYNIGPEATMRAQASDPAAHDEVQSRIGAVYAELHAAKTLTDGSLNEAQVAQTLSTIRNLPRNVEAAAAKAVSGVSRE